MIIPPDEIFRKAVFFCLKTSEALSKKAAEFTEKEKQD